jgi:hypothetical protein
MIRHHLQTLAPSFAMEPTVTRSGDIAGDEPIRLTIILKPHRPLDPFGPRLSRAECGRRHSTLQTVIDRVVQYAGGHGLTVSHASAAEHCVRLSGTYAEAQSAFEPEQIGLYRWGNRDLICRLRPDAGRAEVWLSDGCDRRQRNDRADRTRRRL